MKFKSITQSIVASSIPVLSKYVPDKYDLRLNYVDIFPKSKTERDELLAELKASGKSVWPGSTGNTYLLNEPIETKKGLLKLVRIRIFEQSKTVFRGHPDFALAKSEYESFKNDLLDKSHTKLIKRPEYEMLEIWDEEFDVAIYFPSISLTEDVENKLGHKI